MKFLLLQTVPPTGVNPSDFATAGFSDMTVMIGGLVAIGFSLLLIHVISEKAKQFVGEEKIVSNYHGDEDEHGNTMA